MTVSIYFYVLLLTINICFASDRSDPDDLVVVGVAFFIDDIFWWENPDSPNVEWNVHSIDVDLNGGNYLLTADIDSDSDMDILGVSGDLIW